jgi:hypothetical protein
MIAPLRKQNNLTKLKTTQRKSPTVRPYVIFSLPSYDTEKKKSVRKRDSYCTDMILDMYSTTTSFSSLFSPLSYLKTQPKNIPPPGRDVAARASGLTNQSHIVSRRPDSKRDSAEVAARRIRLVDFPVCQYDMIPYCTYYHIIIQYCTYVPRECLHPPKGEVCALNKLKSRLRIL